MMQGFAKVPPKDELLYRVIPVHNTMGPQLVQSQPLSSVKPPGVWFHAGCPFPLEPYCVVFGAITGFALTEISCSIFPVESTISPIVEYTLLGSQVTAADALGVTVVVG